VILVTLALLHAGPVAAEYDDDGPGGGSPGGGAPGGGSPGGGPGAGQGGEGALHGFDLAASLDRIAALGAAVANLSFAGPSNAVIDAAGAAAARQGTVLVAAAGNDGPRAPPRYPAAHPRAVAVTAVDAAGCACPCAAAGPHVAFAAHGVEVLLPSLPGSPARRWSGTSFAAPLVTAALAAEASVGRRQEAGVAALAAAARDLGRPGRDPVFGWGLVAPGRCAPPPPAEPVAR
jgi:subtilisin family serine protease